jgi:cytochrome c553
MLMLFTVAFIAFVLLITGCAASPKMSFPVAGDVERGAQLFADGQGDIPPCSTCHFVASGQFGFSIGPNLAGVGERAGNRLAELTAKEYLLQSIVEPRRYVVNGYRDIMYSEYETYLSEQDLLDLLAYLLTL